MDHTCQLQCRERVNGHAKTKRDDGVIPFSLAGPSRDTSHLTNGGDYLDRCVRPQHFIDNYAKKMFPLLFGLFNIIYWSYYLPQHHTLKDTMDL